MICKSLFAYECNAISIITMLINNNINLNYTDNDNEIAINGLVLEYDLYIFKLLINLDSKLDIYNKRYRNDIILYSKNYYIYTLI